MGTTAVAGGLAPVVSIFDRSEVGRELEPWRSKRWVAGHFEVSVRTIERWMRDPRYRRGGRQVPFTKAHDGGDVRFKLSLVEAWFRSGEAGGKDGPA